MEAISGLTGQHVPLALVQVLILELTGVELCNKEGVKVSSHFAARFCSLLWVWAGVLIVCCVFVLIVYRVCALLLTPRIPQQQANTAFLYSSAHAQDRSERMSCN